jgi:hypothetical protein
MALKTPRHPKVLKVSPAARWLWFAAICHAREHETDGRVDREAIDTLGVPRPWPLVGQLLASRMFEEDGEGYRVPGFEDWQETRAEIEERRQETRERVAEFRRKRVGNE